MDFENNVHRTAEMFATAGPIVLIGWIFFSP